MSGDIVEKLAARFIASDLDRAQFLLDPDGTIRSWNPGAQILLGYEADAALGQPMAMLYSAADTAAGKPRDDLDRAVTYGRYAEEGWRRRQDSTEFAADARIIALRDEGGALLGFGGTIDDITDRKAAAGAIEKQGLKNEWD